MHATELARERDTLNGQIERLRNELDETRREVQNVRRSVVEEKQSLEHKLDEVNVTWEAELQTERNKYVPSNI